MTLIKVSQKKVEESISCTKLNIIFYFSTICIMIVSFLLVCLLIMCCMQWWHEYYSIDDMKVCQDPFHLLNKFQEFIGVDGCEI